MTKLLVILLGLFYFSSFAQEVDVVLKIRDMEDLVIEEYREIGASLLKLKKKKILLLKSIDYEVKEEYKGILFIGGIARLGAGCVNTIILCSQLGPGLCGGDGKVTITVEEESLSRNSKKGYLIIDNRKGGNIKSCD